LEAGRLAAVLVDLPLQRRPAVSIRISPSPGDAGVREPVRPSIRSTEIPMRAAPSAQGDRMFRRRRQAQDRQQGGGPADQGSRYLLREKLLSIGDDFWIENDLGDRVFH